MTYLATAPGRCPNCGRILFTTRAGLWPYHFNLLRSTPADPLWCTASGTTAPEVRIRSVIA